LTDVICCDNSYKPSLLQEVLYSQDGGEQDILSNRKFHTLILSQHGVLLEAELHGHWGVSHADSFVSLLLLVGEVADIPVFFVIFHFGAFDCIHADTEYVLPDVYNTSFGLVHLFCLYASHYIHAVFLGSLPEIVAFLSNNILKTVFKVSLVSWQRLNMYLEEIAF